MRQFRYDRRSARAQCVLERIWIRFERKPVTVARTDRKFISLPYPRARDERSPHTARVLDVHRISVAIPTIEIADDRRAACTRRPNGKFYAIDAFVFAAMRAKIVVKHRALHQLPINCFDALAQVTEVAIVLNHIIRHLPCHFGIDLRGHARAHLPLVDAITLNGTRNALS